MLLPVVSVLIVPVRAKPLRRSAPPNPPPWSMTAVVSWARLPRATSEGEHRCRRRRRPRGRSFERDGPCDDLASWRLSVDGAERDLSESFGYVGPTPPISWVASTSTATAARRSGPTPVGTRYPPDTRCSASAPAGSTMCGSRPAHQSSGRSLTGPNYQRGVACQSGGEGASTVIWYAANANTPAGEPRLVSVRTYHLNDSVLRLDGQISVPDDTASATFWQLRCGALSHNETWLATFLDGPEPFLRHLFAEE